MRSRAALLLCVVLLAGGCADAGQVDGSDEAGTPTATASSPSDATPGEETTDTPPEVAPASGPWLDTGYAKVRAPKGWRRSDNFGFERVQQASTKVPHPALIHLALHQREPAVGSVEELARFTARELRTRLRMGRFDVGEEVVVAGTRATRLDGQVTDQRAATAYAVMVGDLRWTLLFDISPAMPEEDREELMASVLATWEFVRPS